jgi:hypothetical protein
MLGLFDKAMKIASVAEGRAAPPESAAEPPFVLVANDREGKWDVYALQFDTPVASFAAREPACQHAAGLARLRRDCLILLRTQQAHKALN